MPQYRTLPPGATTRLLAKVDTTDPQRCWIWQGAQSKEGYGHFRLYPFTEQAHRVAYWAFIGPIPDGLEIDHLCRQRACINWRHLEAVTKYQNMIRGEGLCARYARRVACKHGHPYTPESVYLYRGARLCRICMRARDRARRHRS
jgi:hypothetical protein